jgi:hypothetical protein
MRNLSIMQKDDLVNISHVATLTWTPLMSPAGYVPLFFVVVQNITGMSKAL